MPSDPNPPQPPGRQPTPAPTPLPHYQPPPPTAPPTSGSATNPDVEENLLKTNEALVAQNIVFQQMLAEQGMAEISRWEWVDLRRTARISYRRGAYMIDTPPSSNPPPRRVVLRWRPGRIILAETYQVRQDNSVELRLPPVRTPVGWELPAPRPTCRRSRGR